MAESEGFQESSMKGKDLAIRGKVGLGDEDWL